MAEALRAMGELQLLLLMLLLLLWLPLPLFLLRSLLMLLLQPFAMEFDRQLNVVLYAAQATTTAADDIFGCCGACVCL